MTEAAEIIRQFRWADLSQDAAWQKWRAAKIAASESLAAADPVEVASLADPGVAAPREIARRCALVNYALFHVQQPEAEADRAGAALLAFARRFGLTATEAHRSAAAAGVVALRVSAAPGRVGYIPYTSRAMNWHTDGYYNPADRAVMGFLLYCHRPALRGGANRLLDPEIAYLRLRDENPDFIRALMHPQAMTIPENREADGALRPASVGPVFLGDPAGGRLQMRYTARTRSIVWRNDASTLAAAARLREMLTSGDPLIRPVRLGAGHGVLNNNVLHDRTEFEDGPSERDARVVLRVRFHARVAEDLNDAA